MSKNLSELSGRKGIVDNLFEKMGQASESTGTPTKEDLDHLAKEFLVGTSSTYGASSFYDFMKPENKGKKIYICNGSACLCAGTQQNLQETLESNFKADEIGHMTCLGRCHENGAFHYNGKNYSAKSTADVLEIVTKKNKSGNSDRYNVEAPTPVLTLPYIGFEAHWETLKTALKRSPESILQEIKDSEIRGRGGAGFTMGVKLEACSKEINETKFIICNADEGDPGAYSDRYLLEERPHSVLFGMMMAGYAVGSSWGIVYIRGEYPESIAITKAAIEELRNNNLLGQNILNSGFDFDIKVIEARGAYICGEETALINSIEGQRPEVRTRPPYPTTQGLFNKPTVVNNVETLAALHYIIKNTGKTYKSLGTEKSTGTKLISLDSFFNNPGIYEVEMGTPLASVIYEMAGGFKKPVKALHIGGPLGGIVPIHKIQDLTIDFESFSSHGFLLGHASVVSIPADFPMIKYLEHLFEFAAFESCGKCFPCRLGTKRAHEMLKKTAETDYKISRDLFDDLMSTLQQGSLCAHGGGIPLPAKNALAYFGDELDKHFEK
jgi:NADH:ubiquinone oxidoreductase subunit F (NADH-binding)/NADH:ubiquinone oxidoreductase subunit E